VGAWNGLGETLVRQGDVEQGKRCFLKALKIDPGSTKARLNLIEELVRQGEKGEALRQVRADLSNDSARPS
jgi:Flp pilus assembly protein TadD